MQPGLGVSRLLSAGLWQELFITERDRCGGVARVGVVPIEVPVVVVGVYGTGVGSEDGVVALGGHGGVDAFVGVGIAVADEVTEIRQTEG